MDETGLRGFNMDGERHEVKIKGQAYSQAPVITALRTVLAKDVKQETEWLETKISRNREGGIRDPRHVKLRVDLGPLYGTFGFSTFYTDDGK